ncbi:MAG: ankyrin repeat domain-containing protein [Rickettsiales bacterium]|nr:ankyrin repeat domain-containing protein [Rickettsiales bacterium]
MSKSELEMPILIAANVGSVEYLKTLLGQGISPNTVNVQGRSLLMITASAGHRNCVAKLIAHKANLELQDKEGYTALMHAIEAGQEDIALDLMKAKASIHHQDKFGRTPLIVAVEAGSLNLVTELHRRGANIDQGDNDRTTPLMLSIEKGRNDIALYLLESGAQVNKQYYTGETALMFAYHKANQQLISKLLEMGANTALQNEDGVTVLMFAIDEDDLASTLKFLAQGEDINQQTKNGDTALMYGILRSREEIALAMIGSGRANFNLVNKVGDTALTIAAETNQKNLCNAIVAQTLLQKNNEAAWQLMIERLSNPTIVEKLAKATAKLVYASLPEGEVRKSFIKNFNRSTRSAPLDVAALELIPNLVSKLKTLLTAESDAAEFNEAERRIISDPSSPEHVFCRNQLLDYFHQESAKGVSFEARNLTRTITENRDEAVIQELLDDCRARQPKAPKNTSKSPEELTRDLNDALASLKPFASGASKVTNALAQKNDVKKMRTAIEELAKIPDFKINTISLDGWTPLHFAARFGDVVEDFEQLISLGSNTFSEAGGTGTSVLALASSNPSGPGMVNSALKNTDLTFGTIADGLKAAINFGKKGILRSIAEEPKAIVQIKESTERTTLLTELKKITEAKKSFSKSDKAEFKGIISALDQDTTPPKTTGKKKGKTKSEAVAVVVANIAAAQTVEEIATDEISIDLIDEAPQHIISGIEDLLRDEKIDSDLRAAAPVFVPRKTISATEVTPFTKTKTNQLT